MSRCRQCGWPWVERDGLCSNCLKLQAEPDALSKRKSLMGMPFNDMKQMDEPERIKHIVNHIRSGRETLILVDTGKGHEDKGDRYIRAIRQEIPGVKLLSRKPGPVAGCESIVFKL